MVLGKWQTYRKRRLKILNFWNIMFGQNTIEPEWFWASGKPVLDSMFGPNTLDDSPEWYWAYGKPGA